MTATATLSFAETITPTLKIVQGLYAGLLEGITPETFARMPEGVVCNHPAFILGHLSLYPPMILARLGAEQVAPISDEHAAIFTHETECVDDPDGTVYPPMQEIIDQFNRVMTQTIEAVGQLDPAVLQESPADFPFFNDFPTKASVAAFILTAHPMMHSGQLSTWRRCMGLGAASLG